MNRTVMICAQFGISTVSSKLCLASVLRIIPTPWEVTLSRLLSIVSDFEREGHLKYKLA